MNETREGNQEAAKMMISLIGVWEACLAGGMLECRSFQLFLQNILLRWNEQTKQTPQQMLFAKFQWFSGVEISVFVNKLQELIMGKGSST